MSSLLISRLFIFFLLFYFHQQTLSYELKTCCSPTNSTRLLSCPLNFQIRLRSVIFHMGNGCATSQCQKRLNKHYLLCNYHRTCSISIECIHMDNSQCPSLNNGKNQSEFITVDYDCQLYQTKENPIVLFSAQVNIESPVENFTETIDENQREEQWREYLVKKYLQEQQIESKTIFNDVVRTGIILFVFASILIVVMLIGLFIYKRRRASYSPTKHRPFPTTDDAYDNFKSTRTQSITDSGEATDV